MRPLVITQNMTLDGSVEMLDGWFDPQLQSPDLVAELHRHDANCDAVLLGRRTFDDFRSYWPGRTDDTTGAAAFLDSVDKYVVSTTLTDPGWTNSHVLGGDWRSSLRDLKNSDGRDIVVTGSITLCHALIEAGLVDEYRFFIYPAVQARGRTLFPATGAAVRLIEPPVAFDAGVVLLRYAPVRSSTS